MTPPQETETPLTDAAAWILHCGPDGNGSPRYVVDSEFMAEQEKRAILAETKLAAMRSVLERLLNTLHEHGDMDEGCYYYNGNSASELESPIREATTILVKP